MYVTLQMFLCGDLDAFATLCFCLYVDWRSSLCTD